MKFLTGVDNPSALRSAAPHRVGLQHIEIASKMDISVKTVEAHKARALQKLGISRCNDIVRYAILQGWMQEN